jgi:hypothetical protein
MHGCNGTSLEMIDLLLWGSWIHHLRDEEYQQASWQSDGSQVDCPATKEKNVLLYSSITYTV